ncbi:MAG: hypothetical protein ACRC33_29650 [Gemmataceae bacterium]
MVPKLYLGAGTAVLVGFAVSAFSGWEFRAAEQGVPTPGAAVVASSWFRSSGSSGGRSYWYSSSSRSGTSVFGGK